MRAHKGAHSNGRKCGETPSDASKTALPAGFFVRMGEWSDGGVRAFEGAFEGPENDVRTAFGRSEIKDAFSEWIVNWIVNWIVTFPHGINRNNANGSSIGSSKNGHWNT